MLAPPGAGKGTQATRLAEHFGIEHLSSGEMFRREVASSSAVGRLAASYVAHGDLVPDDVVLAMVLPRVVAAAEAGGYVLDGFPRTLRQAEAAHDAASARRGIEPQAVIHLQVDAAELRRRMLERGEAEGRTDDVRAIIAHRLDVFYEQTEPLLVFYEKRALVVEVDGSQPVDRVTATVLERLEELVGER
jgi:adenylate kinase